MSFERIKMIQIDYFIAVAHHLNFTKAAKSLYISQPSLSKQVALLEQEIGVQLLYRTKRTVRLTPAGIILLKELSDIKQRLNVAFEKSRQSGLGENSPITIGCLDAMNTDIFIPELLNRFKEQHPNVKIILERHSFRLLREKVLDGTLDIIFTLSFEIDSTLEIASDVLYDLVGSIFMSSSNPLAKRESLSLKDLKNENFVMISRDESPRGFDGVIKICRDNGFTPNIVKQLPNIESLLMCVESGLGVTVLDSNVRLHNKDKFKIFEIVDDYISIVMAWKKDNMDPAIPFFISSLLKDIDILGVKPTD